MIETRILDRIADVPAAEWDALVGDAGSPFLEHAFLHALESTRRVGEGTGWLPRHVTVRRDGVLVAAAPAYLKTHSQGEFVFDHAWAAVAQRLGLPYYPKLIVAVPFTPVTGDRLLVADSHDRAPLVDTLVAALAHEADRSRCSSTHVLFPREGELSELSAHGFDERLGAQFHWHDRGYDGFDGFLASLGAKKKAMIARERRVLREQGVRVETLRGEAIDEATLAVSFRCYLSTVDRYFYGQRYLDEAFFRRLRETWASRLEVVVARLDGRPVATALNVQKGDRLYGRYWGALADVRFLHFEVCYYHSVEQCLARGIRAFEPGAGGEHKERRGFVPTLTRSAHVITDGRLDRIVRAFLEHERPLVRTFVAEGA